MTFETHNVARVDRTDHGSVSFDAHLKDVNGKVVVQKQRDSALSFGIMPAGLLGLGLLGSVVAAARSSGPGGIRLPGALLALLGIGLGIGLVTTMVWPSISGIFTRRRHDNIDGLMAALNSALVYNKAPEDMSIDELHKEVGRLERVIERGQDAAKHQEDAYERNIQPGASEESRKSAETFKRLGQSIRDALGDLEKRLGDLQQELIRRGGGAD